MIKKEQGEYMKNVINFAAMLALAMTSCAAASAVKTTEPVSADRSEIIGMNWYLLEIKKDTGVIDLNRSQLAEEGNDDVYSLRFSDTGISGKAAPNTYRAPCKWGSGNYVSFGAMASTMMFAFKEPDALKEYEYTAYLARVYRWDLTEDGLLELSARDTNDIPSVLVFGPQP
jgi:heat shock protein HslJ